MALTANSEAAQLWIKSVLLRPSGAFSFGEDTFLTPSQRSMKRPADRRRGGVSGRLATSSALYRGTLDDLRWNWDALAERDAMWAVLTDPRKASRRWITEEFLQSGEREIAYVLARLAKSGVAVNMNYAALDFGCGAGRLTQALARRFRVAHGVDISERMISEARRLNRRENCHFHVNVAADLALFDSGSFSFVYTSIVLQHMHPRFTRGYLAELLRLLRVGGVLVFQVPDRFQPEPALRRALCLSRQAITRVRVLLALRNRVRNWREGGRRPTCTSVQMEMHSVEEVAIRKWVAADGGHIIDVGFTNSTALDFNGDLRYLRDEPDSGWVSKQYTVIRG